jgi:hypothetical protein
MSLHLPGGPGLPVPSSSAVADGNVGLPLIANAVKVLDVVHFDESVLLHNVSTIWFVAIVYLCLVLCLYGNFGTFLQIRQSKLPSPTTGPLMMLIIGLLLGALWLPSIPFVLLSFTNWYLKALDKSPLLTKSVTAGLIQFAGDYAAQCYEGKIDKNMAVSPDDRSDSNTLLWWSTKNYNLRRGISLFVDGLVLSGPLMHYGYQWMEQAIPTRDGDWKAIVCHVLIDDYMIDNLYIALSFVFTGVSEGHGKDLSSIFRKDYWATMRASLYTNLLLIPVECFCFGYLPIQFRTLFMNFVDLLWGAIISFMSHRSRRNQTVSLSG